MSRPSIPACQRCDTPMSEATEPVRITIHQVANPITVLRLVCPGCAKDFTRWWLQGVANASAVSA